jgi:hypothetical protein
MYQGFPGEEILRPQRYIHPKEFHLNRDRSDTPIHRHDKLPKWALIVAVDSGLIVDVSRRPRFDPSWPCPHAYSGPEDYLCQCAPLW